MANEARYGIKIDSNAAEVGTQGASALEQLRAKLEESKSAVKSYGAQLRDLTGDSKEVADAKKTLVDKLNAEKTAITQGQLELQKAGTTYDKLQTSQKKLNDEKKKAEEAIKKEDEANKKAESARKSGIGVINSLKTAIEEMTAADLAFAAADAVATAGIVVLVAAVAGATIAIPALTKSFAEYALTASNTLRTQQLTREGFLGNATDAQHLGHQIDALTAKTDLNRAELNAMSTELAQANVKGMALVNTLAAVSQETTGLNAVAGNKVKEIITRGALFGNFALGQLELVGTGLQFADVAKALAKNTKVSVDEASTALMQGRVSLAAGAQAMKDAVESRFGELNLRKLSDVNVIAKKFSDNLQLLAKDIHLEGLLKSFQSLADLIDQSNEAGQGFKEIVTFLGQGLADSFSSATPGIKGFIEELELGGLNLESDYLDIKLQFLETFGPDVLDKVDAFTVGVKAAETAAGALAAWGKPIQALASNLKDAADALDKLGKLKSGTMSKGFAAGGLAAASPLLALLPSFAAGLERVPADDFPARLHKDERVLTKDEADAYRRIENLSRSGAGARASVSGGEGTATAGGLSAQITVQVAGPSGGGAPQAEVEESARRGTLRALEIFARTRGLSLRAT